MNPYQLAGIFTVILLFFLLLFHLGVLIHLIPSKKVWGGRVLSGKVALFLEIISFTVTLLFLWVILHRLGFVAAPFGERLIRTTIGLMPFIFLFSAIGNALSANQWERKYMLPLSLVLSMSALLLTFYK